MRLRTLGAVCASCAAAAPSPARAADAPPPPAAALSAPLVGPATASSVHAVVMRGLLDRHVATKRRHVRLLGERLSRSERGDLRDQLRNLTPAHLRARTREPAPGHPLAAQAPGQPPRRRARRPDPRGARRDRAVRVARQPAGRLGQRDLPRQVPVLVRHLADGRRQGRSSPGLRDRAGSPRGDALSPRRPRPVAGLRSLETHRARSCRIRRSWRVIRDKTAPRGRRNAARR